MGCTPSSQSFEPAEFDRVWNNMNNNGFEKSSDAGKVGKHKTWKILRVNLISTFKDFRNERAHIHRMIEERIQPIASKNKIFVQLEDFNSGSKASYEDPYSAYLLANVMEQSKQECGNPLYIHLLGECTGYVLDHTFTDENFLQTQGLNQGMSLNEIALKLAGGTSNRNALFLSRDSSFMDEVPFNVQTFIEDEGGRDRAAYFMQTIKKNAKQSQFMTYFCKTEGFNNPHFKQIVLTNLEPMEQRVKQHIESVFGNFVASLSAAPSTQQLIEEHMKKSRDSQQYKMARSELMSKARNPGLLLLVGDYGTGKTKMLTQAAKDLGGTYYSASDTNITSQVSSAIQQGRGCILIDDAENLGRELSKILPKDKSDYKSAVVLAFRKAHIIKGQDPQVVTIPAMDDHEANKSLARWIAGSKKKGRDRAQKKAEDIVRAGQQFKRRAQTAKVEKRRASIASVEEGKGEVVWNEWKCRVIGSLVRFGASEEKSAALASLSTVSVCEAELYTFEAEAKGHLIIGTLCLLAICPIGLTEIEIRYLLFPEDELLPTGIRRRFRNLPFEYNLEKYGSYPQVSALRWRYVSMRLEHYFVTIDKDCNHFILPSVCKKAVKNKFLNSESHTNHFRGVLRKLGERRFPWTAHRVNELSKYF